MESKDLKKQILLALMPIVALSMLVLFTTLPKSISASANEDDSSFSIQSEYATQEQKQEAPSPEPVYISIFKFIVNCNPFQKETQL